MDFPETFDEYRSYRAELKSPAVAEPPVQEQASASRPSSYDALYEDWRKDRSAANMTRLLEAFSPTINSEITRYEGSRPLLRARAKVLTVKAIKSYNPASGARLQSWIVTNLQPLARYGQKQRDVHAPEVAIRQAAGVHRVAEELKSDLGRDPTDEEIADEVGISPKRVAAVRKMVVPSVTSGQFDELATDDDESSISPGVVVPSQVPFAQEAVYMSLDDTDKFIFDALTGLHGGKQLSGAAVAARLGVSPAAVSQRAKSIATRIAEVANGQ